MPRKGLDEPGNFNRTCGFMGLCRQRHKPGHPAGEIEGSWAIDKESGEKTAAPSTLSMYVLCGIQRGGCSMPAHIHAAHTWRPQQQPPIRSCSSRLSPVGVSGEHRLSTEH